MIGEVARMITKKWLKIHRQVRERTAFKPHRYFIAGCPPVCANCTHWKHELFAWGLVDYCDVTYRNREAGTICDAIIRSNK